MTATQTCRCNAKISIHPQAVLSPSCNATSTRFYVEICARSSKMSSNPCQSDR
ncbi:MAG TPA: hypothetical protein V6D31_03915 [Candidatus Sericytochromatia bacterium]